MSKLADAIRDYVEFILHNLNLLRVREIRSIEATPMRIAHDSGGELEFRNDGKVYYNGTELGSDDITTTEKVKAPSGKDLTFEVDTGQTFIFQKV